MSQWNELDKGREGYGVGSEDGGDDTIEGIGETIEG